MFRIGDVVEHIHGSFKWTVIGQDDENYFLQHNVFGSERARKSIMHEYWRVVKNATLTVKPKHNETIDW